MFSYFSLALQIVNICLSWSVVTADIFLVIFAVMNDEIQHVQSTAAEEVLWFPEKLLVATYCYNTERFFVQNTLPIEVFT